MRQPIRYSRAFLQTASFENAHHCPSWGLIRQCSVCHVCVCVCVLGGLQKKSSLGRSLFHFGSAELTETNGRGAGGASFSASAATATHGRPISGQPFCATLESALRAPEGAMGRMEWSGAVWIGCDLSEMCAMMLSIWPRICARCARSSARLSSKFAFSRLSWYLSSVAVSACCAAESMDSFELPEASDTWGWGVGLGGGVGWGWGGGRNGGEGERVEYGGE